MKFSANQDLDIPQFELFDRCQTLKVLRDKRFGEVYRYHIKVRLCLCLD